MAQHAVSVKRNRPRFLRFKYVGEIINELKKVVWLTRREVTYLTTLVLVIAILAGITLGAFDYGFSGLIDKIFLGK